MLSRAFRVKTAPQTLIKVAVQRGEHYVTVVLEGNHLMVYKIFPVDAFRVSLDLENVRSNLKFPELPVDHILLTRIRIGQHKDKLRLVFDLKMALNKELKYAVRARGNQLAVRFVKV
ncbi:MAG: AMIN domain-containing protein [Nitrospirota bacterium]|nr:AMIN domain-containing protein [Nitrospirota bacterium]